MAEPTITDPNPLEPHFALRACDLDALGRLITELSAHINAATGRLHAMVGEFDRRGGWGGAGILSCEHWLQLRYGETPGASRELVQAARASETLPRTAERFATGELSVSAARTIARSATCETEDVMLHFARYGTGSHLTRLCTYYRRVLATLEPETARMMTERYLRYRYDDDGALRLTGRFPGDEGEVIRRALEAAIDELNQELQSDRKAHDERAEQGEHDDEHADALATRNTELRYEERCADALIKLAEAKLDARSGDGQSADRFTVVLHVDMKTLSGAQDDPAGLCELARGTPLPPELARFLSCDARLPRMLEDTDGNPLHLGRRTRAIRGRIRAALEARDRTCRYPGCVARRHLHGHHLTHWALGGADRPLEPEMSHLSRTAWAKPVRGTD